MRYPFIFVVAALAILFLNTLASATRPVFYQDATGRQLDYCMDAKRIVSLAPNVTEMLYFLGLGDRVVGRSDYCNYPPEVKRLPSVGGFADSSLEKIVALSPDLVIVYQGNSRELVQLLRAAGIVVLAFNEARDLREIADQMSAIWHIVVYENVPDLSADPKKVQNWRWRMGELSEPASKARPRVFFGYPGEMSMSCAPGSFLSDLIERAGGTNIVPKSEQRWSMVSAEFIVGAQPEWLITATSCTKPEDAAAKQAALLKQLKADRVWAALPAVKNGRILVFDSDILLRPGPRILDALEKLHAALTGGHKD